MVKWSLWRDQMVNQVVAFSPWALGHAWTQKETDGEVTMVLYNGVNEV